MRLPFYMTSHDPKIWQAGIEGGNDLLSEVGATEFRLWRVAIRGGGFKMFSSDSFIDLIEIINVPAAKTDPE
jgi:hypothetical protein